MSTFENNAHYQVEILDHSFDETPNGNPRLNFKVKILKKIKDFGSDAPHFSPAEMNVDRNLSLVFATEGQREWGVKKLRFAGWRGSDFADFDMIGKEVIVLNTHQQGEGKNAGKVYDNFDLALPPMASKDIGDEKKGARKKMNALLGKLLKENPAPADDEAPEKPAKASGKAKADDSPAKEPDGASSDAGGDEVPF